MKQQHDTQFATGGFTTAQKTVSAKETQGPKSAEKHKAQQKINNTETIEKELEDEKRGKIVVTQEERKVEIKDAKTKYEVKIETIQNIDRPLVTKEGEREAFKELSTKYPDKFRGV